MRSDSKLIRFNFVIASLALFKAKQSRFFIFILILILGISACSSTPTAPIVEGWRQPAGKSSDYVVQKGDTLYSIAWAFDMDFRDLAQLNHIAPPAYKVQAGQRLKMGAGSRPIPVITQKSAPSKIYRKPLFRAAQPQSTPVSYRQSAPINPSQKWKWPAQGKVVRGYSTWSGGSKGIEIAGRLGEPVVASAAGRVVYSGSGLRGYGNLIIIKHNDTFLSAYAFNQKLLVKEGATVSAGQTIALMGKNTAGQVRLHFEIRRNGKPVDPLKFLQ